MAVEAQNMSNIQHIKIVGNRKTTIKTYNYRSRTSSGNDEAFQVIAVVV
jgi:hypothetical protein